jgi:hypothetical protein
VNFYIYELSKLIFVQQRGWAIFRPHSVKYLKLNNTYYRNYESLETVLYSYVFLKH